MRGNCSFPGRNYPRFNVEVRLALWSALDDYPRPLLGEVHDLRAKKVANILRNFIWSRKKVFKFNDHHGAMFP